MMFHAKFYALTAMVVAMVMVGAAQASIGVLNLESVTYPVSLDPVTEPANPTAALAISNASYFKIRVQLNGATQSAVRFIKARNGNHIGDWDTTLLGTFDSADTVSVTFVDPSGPQTTPLEPTNDPPATGAQTKGTVDADLATYAAGADEFYVVPYGSGDEAFKMRFAFVARPPEQISYTKCAHYDETTRKLSFEVDPKFFAMDIILDAKQEGALSPLSLELEYGTGDASAADGILAQGSAALAAMTWAGVDGEYINTLLQYGVQDKKGLPVVGATGWVRVHTNASSGTAAAPTPTLNRGKCLPSQRQMFIVGAIRSECKDVCATTYKEESSLAACDDGCNKAHPALNGADFNSTSVCKAAVLAAAATNDADTAAAAQTGCAHATPANPNTLKCYHRDLKAKLAGVTHLSAAMAALSDNAIATADSSARLKITSLSCLKTLVALPTKVCTEFACDRAKWVGIRADHPNGCSMNITAECTPQCDKQQLSSVFGTGKKFDLASVADFEDADKVVELNCMHQIKAATGTASFKCVYEQGNAPVWEKKSDGCKYTVPVETSTTLTPEPTTVGLTAKPTPKIAARANATARPTSKQGANSSDTDMTGGEIAGLVILIFIIIVVSALVAWASYHAYINRNPKAIYNQIDGDEVVQLSPFQGQQSNRSLNAKQLNAQLLDDGVTDNNNIYPMATNSEETDPFASNVGARQQSVTRATVHDVSNPTPEDGSKVINLTTKTAPLAAQRSTRKVTSSLDYSRSVHATLQRPKSIALQSDEGGSETTTDGTLPRAKKSGPLMPKKTIMHRPTAAQTGRDSLAHFAEEMKDAPTPQGQAAPMNQKQSRPLSLSLNTTVGTSATDRSVRGWNPRAVLTKTAGGVNTGMANLGEDEDLGLEPLDQSNVLELLEEEDLHHQEFTLEADGSSLRLKSTRKANPLFAQATTQDNSQNLNKIINSV